MSSTNKKVSNSELFGDSSSSDEDDDASNDKMDESKEETTTTTVATTKDKDAPRRPTLQDSDPDSDDDAEFDDKGIVGLKSSTVAGTVQNNSKTTINAGDVEPAQHKKDVYNLTVQAATRPSADTELYFTRLPNLIGIQPEVFDPDTFTAAAEEMDYSVHDMMRWRYQRDEAGHVVRDDNDALQRESNTRLVEWEDGTFTLHIGKEAFEVDGVNSGKAGFAGHNGYLYLSQKATKSKPSSSATATSGDGEEKQDDNNAVQEPAGTVLECMGPMKSRLMARPSIQGAAHKSMTVAVRQKTIKKARIAEFQTELDPEKLKQERIQVKEELEKAEARKRAGYSGYGGGRRAGGGGGGGSRPRMSRDYLEDDANYDTTNIKSLKRGEFDEMDDYGEDSDESEEETFNKARPTRRGRDEAAAARKKQESSSDDDDILMDDDDDDDDDEEVMAPKAKPSKKRSVQAVIDDSDSD